MLIIWATSLGIIQAIVFLNLSFLIACSFNPTILYKCDPISILISNEPYPLTIGHLTGFCIISVDSEISDDLYLDEYMHASHIYDSVLYTCKGVICDPTTHLDFCAFVKLYA